MYILIWIKVQSHRMFHWRSIFRTLNLNTRVWQKFVYVQCYQINRLEDRDIPSYILAYLVTIWWWRLMTQKIILPMWTNMTWVYTYSQHFIWAVINFWWYGIVNYIVFTTTTPLFHHTLSTTHIHIISDTSCINDLKFYL